VISVIVPARDAAATLGACLEAVRAQDAEHELIVVDDGSADATAAIASRAGARVIAGAGRGPGAARDAGIGAASGDVLAFTDADCVPAPGWLRAGLGALARAEVVQGRVEPERPPGPYDRTVSVERFSGLFEAANLFMRRDACRGFAGGISPRRGKELGEDVLAGWRAVRAGARVGFAPDAVVRHAVFERSAGAYVAERARRRFFAELVRRAPELREAFLYRHFFLTARGARFDLALAGLALRRPVLALPYLLAVERDRRARGAGPAVVEVAADAVGAFALAAGSVRARTVVL
jgi:glycosyltransferase involved in cell wall biosynthesis